MPGYAFQLALLRGDRMGGAAARGSINQQSTNDKVPQWNGLLCLVQVLREAIVALAGYRAASDLGALVNVATAVRSATRALRRTCRRMRSRYKRMTFVM